MDAAIRKLLLPFFINLTLMLVPALIRSQNSAVPWAAANMAFSSSSSPTTTTVSHLGQIFVGQTQGSGTRIISGIFIPTRERGSALALDHTNGLPLDYALRQNFPNPFNPSTTIKFELPVATEVYLVVYDLLGREVVWLVNEYMEPGYHRIVWQGQTADGRSVPSGIYITRLVATGFTKSIKMVLLK